MKLSEFVFKFVCEMEDTKFRFTVSKDTEKERLSQCQSCSHYDEETESCGICGCIATQKVKYIFESCPIQKWAHNGQMWEDEYFDFFLSKVIDKHPEAEVWKQQN